MSQFKIRTRVMTTAAALTLFPAIALAGGDSTHGSPSGGTSQGSTVSPSAEPSTAQSPSGAQPGSSASGSTAAGSGASGSQPSQQSASAQSVQGQSQVGAQSQASIDPAQVQKVFGMDVTLVDLKSLDNAQIRQLQQTLQERGHYRGNVDGIVGPQTRSALTALLAEQYSLNQRLVNQGQITQQLAQSIGIDAQGRTPVSGVDSPPNQMNMPSTSPSPSQQGTTPSTRSFPSSPSGQQPSSPSMDDTSSPPDDSRTGDDSMDHNAPQAPR